MAGGPDFSFERAAEKRSPGACIAGVDEAGCAPLAGPVVAAAAVLDRKALPRALRDGLDDSKKVTPARREDLYALLMASDAAIVGVGRAEVHEIESFNILNAAHLAMRRAVAALGRDVTLALIDGNRTPKVFPCAVETIVKGDGKSLSIAAASIVAKVTRDHIMADLARAHPGYGWERNAGYPTPEHRAAILARGLTPHHRKTFGPVRTLLAGDAAAQENLL